MKQCLLFVVSTVMFAACQAIENPIDYSNCNPTVTKSFESYEKPDFKVSTTDAKRYSDLRNPDKEYKIVPYVCGTDTLMYVFNYMDGWLVVAGDRRLCPVVAECDEGQLDLSKDYQYTMYLRSVADDIALLKKEPARINAEAVRFWQEIAPMKKDHPSDLMTKSGAPKWVVRSYVIGTSRNWEEIVQPLIQTKWGQDDPWNQKLPQDYRTGRNISGVVMYDRCATGCVSVAVAQMLYFLHNKFNYPTALYHDTYCSYPRIASATSDVGFHRASLVQNSERWEEMQSLTNPSGSTLYVSNLMIDIGNRFNTIYSASNCGGSSAQMSNISALQNYGITCSTASDNILCSITNSQLRSGLPVIVTAAGHDTHMRTVNHAWIIDGLCLERYIQRKLRICVYTNEYEYGEETYDTFNEVQGRYGDIQEAVPQYYQVETVDYYYYMNWGQDGIGDNVRYGAYSDWICSGSTFDNNKVLYYDFREY